MAAVSPDAPDPTTITSYCISLVSIGGLRRFHDCLHLFARPADLTGDIERIPIFAPPDNFVVIIHIKDANDARNHFPIIGKWLRASRSEEHTSELQSLIRISYAVFCLKKKKKQQ